MEFEADSSPPSTADVKNLQSFTSCFPTPACTGADNALEEDLTSRNSNRICQQLMKQAVRQAISLKDPNSLHILLSYVCTLLTYRLAFHPFCWWLNTVEIRECFDC